MINTMKDVYAVCQCSFYDFKAMSEELSKSYDVTVNKSVLQINWEDGVVFVFDYGVAIFWQVSPEDRQALLLVMKEFSNQILMNMPVDEFTYEFGVPEAFIKNDHLSMPDDQIVTKLAISQGIAQSTKLEQFEEHVQRSINSTEYIPENIAKTGRSGLRRKDLAKLRGVLYLTISDVMLHFDLLDVPEYFWENPELQSYYTMVSHYLEIQPRIEVLNKKLETIQNLLQMIADEQNHAHSSLLEWIIIWLIAIDIIIMLMQQFVFPIRAE